MQAHAHRQRAGREQAEEAAAEGGSRQREGRNLRQLLVGQNIKSRVQQLVLGREAGAEREKGEGSIIRKLRNVFTHANTCLKIIRDMHSNKAAERA